MTRYADVLLPLPLSEAFTYAVLPEQQDKIRPGIRVLVPFRGKLLTGFVIRTLARARKQGLNVKPIAELLEESPSFSPAFLAFTKKLSRQLFIPWGEILQAALPPSLQVRTKSLYSLTTKGKETLDQGLLKPAESAVALLLKKKAYRLRYLERKLGEKDIGRLLTGMERRGWISAVREVERPRRRGTRQISLPPVQLELDFSKGNWLAQASERIAASLPSTRFSPYLVFGPEGKRQALYLELIKKVRRRAGRVLYLVPELVLASEVSRKIERHAGEEVALLHGRLTDSQREREWERFQKNQVGIILGSRAALLAPAEGVQLVILDGEEDESYDQRDGALVDVRQAAWQRAREEGGTLVMGSASPRVEAFYRAKRGGYLVDLGGEESQKKVILADSRKERALLLRLVLEKIEERLKKKEPVILFFNRRGYAAYLICARCGFIPRCARCGQPLSYHKKEMNLVCHACRSVRPGTRACSGCGSRLIVKRGPGIEAIAEELRRTFPRHRVEVLAKDESSQKSERTALLTDFQEGKIDILLGTRFLARQLDLRPVSLVGILHPETVLHVADFRSSQKAFQAITDYLRFLGHGSRAEAIIQTAAVDHFAIQAAAQGNYEAFYEKEIKLRRLLGYPPFSCLAEVILEGKNSRQVAGQSRRLIEQVRAWRPHVEAFGPSLASPTAGQRPARVKIGLKAAKKKYLDGFLSAVWPALRLKKWVYFFN